MKRIAIRFWIVFVGVQLVAFALLTPRTPVPLRIVAGIMLLPGSAVLVLGHPVSDFVMRSMVSEIAGALTFLGFNACAWYLVLRAVQHKRKTA
jgi:hypothetical protein